MVRLQDYSIYLNYVMYNFKKRDFGGCVISKLNRIWAKFSKNESDEHLHFHFLKVTNIFTSMLQSLISRIDSHNCCEFYTWQWLICVRLKTKIYTLKIERSLCIDQDLNTHINGTWTRENNPQKKKQDKRLPNTRNTASYMCCICEYLQQFHVFAVFCILFIGVPIVAELGIEKFIFVKMSVIVNPQTWTSKFELQFSADFLMLCISDSAVIIMWLASS